MCVRHKQLFFPCSEIWQERQSIKGALAKRNRLLVEQTNAKKSPATYLPTSTDNKRRLGRA